MNTQDIHILMLRLYEAEYAILKQALEIHGGSFDFTGIPERKRTVALHDAHLNLVVCVVRGARLGPGPMPDDEGVFLDVTSDGVDWTAYLDSCPASRMEFSGQLTQLAEVIPPFVKKVEDAWRELDGTHDFPWNRPDPVPAHVKFDAASRSIRAWTDDRMILNLADGLEADRLMAVYLEEVAAGKTEAEALGRVFSDMDLPF